MLSTNGTPKKLASILEQKNTPCSGDCCRLCECLFKVQKGDEFQHISAENLFQLPGKKGVEKWPLEKLLSEDLGLHLSELFLKSVCEVCIKNSEHHRACLFLEREINTVSVVMRLWKTKHWQKWIEIHQSQSTSMT